MIRSVALPDVPTVSEAGQGAFQVNFWSGLVIPVDESDSKLWREG
jgi:tripartite-type tricarboxylate transporter receptor subunit TctC